jgi:hypothetical protein
MTDFIEGWRANGCPDKGFYKHYLNRFFDGCAKGLMPGHIGVKPDAQMATAMVYAMAMRHHVRIVHASVANFSGPLYPWHTAVKRDKAFMQVPYRQYLNAAYAVRAHLDAEFYDTIQENAKVWIAYYGELAEAFGKAYRIEII